MSTTKLRDQPVHLRERYGYRRTPILLWVLAAAVGAVLIVFGVWTAERAANPPVRWQMLVWDSNATDHTNITFEIRRGASQEIQCVLRVQDKLHQDLGYAIVTIPPGNAYVQTNYALATRAKGYAADVLGCAVPGDLHAPTPDFPPGTSNPPQPWRPS